MTVIAGEPLTLHGLQFEIAAVSEQGPRAENQDAFSIDTFPETGLIAVADGMGGERSGRLAADTALEAVVGGEPIHSLDDARRTARRADDAVTRVAERRPEAHAGMGCALGFLSLVTRLGDGTGWVGGHVGDVRIVSRSPDGVLRLETRDHTPAFARWEAGEISLDEIADASGANRLQRAIGRGGEADVVWLPARPGWSWLIISDGVSKVMRLDELGAVMSAATARSGLEALRQKVLERGPDDNFTAVLVRALPDREQAVPPPDPTLPMAGPSTPAPASIALTRQPRRRSAGTVVALLIALLALAAAGGALWLFWQEQKAVAVRAMKTEHLEFRLDSLGAVVQQLRDPFGPTLESPSGDSLAPMPSESVLP